MPQEEARSGQETLRILQGQPSLGPGEKLNCEDNGVGRGSQ